MAIKDYKRVKVKSPEMGDIYYWENQKNGSYVWIQKTGKAYWVNGTVKPTFDIFNKRYDSEQKALASARRFMAKH